MLFHAHWVGRPHGGPAGMAHSGALTFTFQTTNCAFSSHQALQEDFSWSKTKEQPCPRQNNNNNKKHGQCGEPPRAGSLCGLPEECCTFVESGLRRKLATLAVRQSPPVRQAP